MSPANEIWRYATSQWLGTFTEWSLYDFQTTWVTFKYPIRHLIERFVKYWNCMILWSLEARRLAVWVILSLVSCCWDACQISQQSVNLPPQSSFLLMTLVPVQKLCVNIYLYICVHIPYTSSVIGCIYNGSVIQYWRSCTPSCSTGECAVPGLNTMLFSLVYQLCLALW